VIILDTNVISELMRSRPNPTVVAWSAVQPRSLLCTTSINKAEIFYGVAALPEGRRRRGLAAAAEAMFSEDFAGRVLPFDEVAAAHYADIVAARRRSGTPIEALDAQIAAIVVAAGADIATRDVAGFAGCGVAVINTLGGLGLGRIRLAPRAQPRTRRRRAVGREMNLPERA
jgi:predicted nucleic acid-binding protein